jgi:hypothetical protein
MSSLQVLKQLLRLQRKALAETQPTKRNKLNRECAVLSAHLDAILRRIPQ